MKIPSWFRTVICLRIPFRRIFFIDCPVSHWLNSLQGTSDNTYVTFKNPLSLMATRKTTPHRVHRVGCGRQPWWVHNDVCLLVFTPLSFPVPYFPGLVHVACRTRHKKQYVVFQIRLCKILRRLFWVLFCLVPLPSAPLSSPTPSLSMTCSAEG